MATAPHTANCLRCGRKLTSAQSIARGYGRTCGAKIREAAKVVDLAEFKDAKSAHAKAVELIETGSIVGTRHAGQYLAVSSDGTQTYLVDTIERSCTCRGHQRTGHCYHMVAANILTAAAPARRAA